MEYTRGRSTSPGTWFLVFIACVAGAAACGTFNPSTPTSRFVSSSPNVLSVMNWTANNGQLTIHTAIE